MIDANRTAPSSQPLLAESTRFKLLIDTPKIQDWERLLPSGLFFGVTTNPKLMAQAGEPCTLANLQRLAQTAFGMGVEEIHLQVWGMDADSMIRIGRQLAAIDPRVMVKVPATRPGYQATRVLVSEGVSVTLTAMHSAVQVLTAIALGARYAVPYLGRMLDADPNALNEVIAMQEILDHHPGRTQILLASIRQIEHIVELARRGVSVFTLLPPLADQLLDNPLSQKAAAEFEASVQKSLGG